MDKIDLRLKVKPADLEQHFSPVNISLLWAHYWWLSTWTFKNLSAPFWRMYWNDRPGAVISTADQAVPLTPEHVFLISPNTTVSSRIMGASGQAAEDRDCIEGGLISSRSGDQLTLPPGAIRHVSLHFMLGIPYDMLSGKIFCFPLTLSQQDEVAGIVALLARCPGRFAFHETLQLQALVAETIMQIPAEEWTGLVDDERVLSVLMRIENARDTIPTNQELARGLHMTTDSFIRLFRKATGMTPHRYAIINRLVKSAILLNHSNQSIDAIAAECGFEDRNYFTRQFSRLVGMSPAQYRKDTRSQSP